MLEVVAVLAIVFMLVVVAAGLPAPPVELLGVLLGVLIAAPIMPLLAAVAEPLAGVAAPVAPVVPAAPAADEPSSVPAHAATHSAPNIKKVA
jgi:xanthosine utilization system XapX-like protein